MQVTTEEIIKRLQELQLEQQDLLSQLDAINQDTREDIKAGDKIKVRTAGVLCKENDKAVVTKTNRHNVHFKVIRTGHNTHRKRKNVKKIQDNEQ